MSLTQRQIESFEQNGYLVLENFVSQEDVLSTLDYLINLELDVGGASLDDIDHLGNRRVRSVGELLQNQVRVGLKIGRASCRERV